MPTLLTALMFMVVLLAICLVASAACERELTRNAQDEKPQHKKAA